MNYVFFFFLAGAEEVARAVSFTFHCTLRVSIPLQDVWFLNHQLTICEFPQKYAEVGSFSLNCSLAELLVKKVAQYGLLYWELWQNLE